MRERTHYEGILSSMDCLRPPKVTQTFSQAGIRVSFSPGVVSRNVYRSVDRIRKSQMLLAKAGGLLAMHL
jgi:hypothetical protein